MTTKNKLDLTTLPEADLALPAEATEQEWLEVRTGGVGASEVSGILEIDDPDEARGIYHDRYTIWEDKTGRGKALVYDRDHPIHTGNVMEPVLRSELAARLGVQIHVPGLYINRRNPVMRCTVDGLFADPDTGELVLCEFKHNAGYGGLSLWSDPDNAPAHPTIQAMYSMHLLGVKKAIIFALAGGYFQRRDIAYDEEFGTILEEEVTEFWNTYVITDRRPDPTALSLERLTASFQIATPDKTVAVDATLARKLAEEFLAAKKEEDIAKKKRGDHKARVLALVGDAEKLVGPDGEVLFTAANDSTLKVKALREARPDLIAKYTVTKEVFDEAAFKAGEPEVYKQFRARSVKFKGE